MNRLRIVPSILLHETDMEGWRYVVECHQHTQHTHGKSCTFYQDLDHLLVLTHVPTPTILHLCLPYEASLLH